MQRLILAILFVLFAGTAYAQCPGTNTPLTPRSYQQLTVSGTAVGLTLPTTPPIRSALIIVETNQIRWRDDGVDPTATVGMPIPAGGSFVICAPSLSKFRAIRTGSDAVINYVTYSD